MSEYIKVGNYSIEITHPEKIWFPKEKIKKSDIVQYYYDIAPVMIPHMKDRPLSMHRFPDGITGEDFYQKDAPDYFPSWIKRVDVKKTGGVIHHVLCNNQATLVYLATQAVLTPHVWLSKAPKINFPDRLIFDLDVETKEFFLVRETALLLKDFFEDLGLVPFVKTTGSRGLHVEVPLKPTVEFDVVRSFAKEVADYFAAQYPKKLTTEVRKEKRKGRLFLDIARNAYAQTAVAAYAVRARPGAPVATPLVWEEVEDTKLTSQKYNTQNIFKRLDKMGDPWKDINKYARTLTAAQKKFAAMK
jgi:bifunctional non-homologous end joining protein LigD